MTFSTRLNWTSAVLLAITLLAAVHEVKCQTITKAPSMDRTEWALLVADASSRALDVYSTHQMLAKGGHEKFLPDFISHHTATMAAYSGASVALDWWVARKLVRHGHARLAHIVTLIDIGQDAPWAIHNLYIGK